MDGDPATRWSSQFSDPQWITVDLGVPTASSKSSCVGNSVRAGLSDPDLLMRSPGQISTAQPLVMAELTIWLSRARAGTCGWSVRSGQRSGAIRSGSLRFTADPSGLLPLILNKPFPAHPTPRQPSPLADQHPGGRLQPAARAGPDLSLQPPGWRPRGRQRQLMTWGHGQVTTTIAAGKTWGGGWMSLNHPIREGLPINFSAILPAQILPAYQSRITGITARIVRGTPGRTFRLEIKDMASGAGPMK